MNKLEAAREQINAIDRKIAELFTARMAAVDDVLAYKLEHDLPILDAGREAEVMAKNLQLIADESLRPHYARVLQALMDVSKDHQRQLLGQNSAGYCGTEGAFACIAARQIFPSAKLSAYPGFKQVFAAVEAGEIQFGVIPFENSYTGEVGEVLDLLLSFDLHIISSFDLAISQNLLSVPGATLDDIKQVYSHQQGLTQCEDFLARYGWELVPYANTALAAKYVAEQNDRSKAAIASAETAELFGLSILERNINTSKQNTTRFIVIARDENPNGNRFNMLFTVGHNAGQLAKIMEIIGGFGFNLESIKSRPMKNTPWQYYFYAEIIGNLQDEHTQQLLAKLRDNCNLLKVIGSYSISE